MYMQITVKTLFEKRYNKTQIAKLLQLDRKTVRKVLIDQDRDSIMITKTHPSMLDQHREFSEASIAKELSSIRIIQDLQRDAGFESVYTTVRNYVRKLNSVI